jgi:hypothetical protein
VARHAEEPRAGDRLVRAGAVVFLAGLVAIAVMFVPFAVDLVTEGARYAQDRHEYGVALNLATFLTCVGFGLGLLGLYLQARQSRARARAGR